MRNLTVITVLLLCCPSRISVSLSEFHTVEVKSGGQVTLLCSNYTSSPTQIYWFRVVKRVKPHCISHILEASNPARYCDGFQNGRFEAASNISTLFLKIKQVDPSDSGLYFCGGYINQNLFIADATYIEAQDVFDRIAKPMNVVLFGLTVLFTMVVISLVVKIKKLQNGLSEEHNPLQTQVMESQGSDDLNYAAVTFRPKLKGDHTPENSQ